MIYTGRITEIDRVLDKSPVFTVVNSAGAVLFPCYLSSGLGGLDAMHSTPPLRIGAVVILVRPDDNEPFYIMAGIPAPKDQANISLTSEAVTGNYNGHAIDETVIQNTNSSLTLSPKNDAVLDAPSIRLQLQGGKLRISQENTASNGVLNGQPFIDTLFTYLNEIATRITVMSSAITAMYNGMSADLVIEAGEISARITAGTATPADIARLAEINQLTLDINAIQAPLTASGTVQAQAESSINEHISIP
jgi:hypothetical protein